METIKSYTDVEQSKKLAEILPLESADMYYDIADKEIAIPFILDSVFTCMLGKVLSGSIAAWSLAALYGILPNNKKETTTLSRGGWNVESLEYADKWWCEYEDDTHTKDFSVSADNPIDACYEMILKLHGLKML